MIRFLFFVALFWVFSKLLKVFAAAPQRREPESFKPTPSRVDGGELVQDPKCGVYVPKTTALKGKNGDFFCSESCRDEFERRNG